MAYQGYMNPSLHTTSIICSGAIVKDTYTGTWPQKK